MKAFWGSVIALVVISVLAWLALDSLGMSSQAVFSTHSVRL